MRPPAGAQAETYTVFREGGSTTDLLVAKVLKPWSESSKSESEEAQRGRLTREVNALKSLSDAGCPGVVPVVDMFLEAERPGYVMPYYTAGAMAKTDPTSRAITYAEGIVGNVDRVLSIGEDLAETLAWMHGGKSQFVHRDVKASNVFFAEAGGSPTLGDFGLVHERSSQIEVGTLTGATEELGPWQWRPPELRAGSPNQRIPASDIYLLGGLIYEALSGGKHFDDSQPVEGVWTHETKGLNLAETIDDHRIEAINILLRLMLARDARDRIDATTLRNELAKIRQRTPDAGRPDTRMDRMEIRARLDSLSERLYDSGEGRAQAIRGALNEELVTLVEKLQLEEPDINAGRGSDSVDRRINIGGFDFGKEKALAQSLPGGSDRLFWLRMTIDIYYYPKNPKLSASLLVGRSTTREATFELLDGECVDWRETFAGDPATSDTIKE